GKFRTIGEALRSITQPHSTIRILDDANYDERLLISDADKHSGLRIEAPQGATLSNSVKGTWLIEVQRASGVTIRGLHLRSERPGQILIGIRGPAPGLLLEGLQFEDRK